MLFPCTNLWNKYIASFYRWETKADNSAQVRQLIRDHKPGQPGCKTYKVSIILFIACSSSPQKIYINFWNSHSHGFIYHLLGLPLCNYTMTTIAQYSGVPTCQSVKSAFMSPPPLSFPRQV